MEPSKPEEKTDDSSIKPVSSLRSFFESNLGANKAPASASPRLPSPAGNERLGVAEDSKRDGRMSLDIARQNGGRNSTSNLLDVSGNGPATPRGRSIRSPWSISKQRPSSMVAFSPPRSPTRSPPKVTVQSPASPPPPKSPGTQLHSPLPSRNSIHTSLENDSQSPVASNCTKPFKNPSRDNTPVLPLESKPVFRPNHSASPSVDARKSGFFDRNSVSTPPVPPPVNRAGKPKIAGKSHSAEPPARLTLAPGHDAERGRKDVSPFSTPPSSSGGELSPAKDPSPPKRFTTSRDGYFPTPPLHHAVAEKLSSSNPRAIFSNQPSKAAPLSRNQSDFSEDRPVLPARRERDNVDMRKSMVLQRPTPPEPPVRRSMDTFRPAAMVAETNNRFMPPPRRSQTTIMSSNAPAEPHKSLEPPRPPPPRNSGEFRRPAPPPAQTSKAPLSQPYNYDSDEDDTANEKPGAALTDYPDSSQANRRPPVFDSGTSLIPTGYETKLFAICGEYICTTGYVTKVWNVLNGRILMEVGHGDTVKATSVAFRPAKDVEDEGKRLWLGMNTGEMHEIDIPTQSVVCTKSTAHKGAPVVKIFRYAAEMWSLDDEGKLNIWPPDETGSPILQQTPCAYRVRTGHTYSMISGSQLWLAFGRELRVYKRTGDGNYFQELTDRGLSQLNVGDVTSGAILSSQPDRVYFGHNDGKITIYAKKGFECLGIISVSLYKISSLVGVGDHLWAGYSTGMVYVYDTSCTPWKVLKDWKAHEKIIFGILADRTSIWKLDRLQVATLGSDNILRIWDGMMKDDWQENQMHQRDSEYCEFRELTAKVMTWNAGASKPTDLRHNEQDQNFFRELLQPEDPPDILVFGFQELVDLENKKITAKSFFKKKKSKEATEHEHMSHQYRAWRDHLIRVLDEHTPRQNYVLLHTANLVGLFTCIFVKGSERAKIRDVCAAEIKLGFSGRVGNKGALVVRFLIDDSSLCFINCHLAAGQSQTQHRNNDAASIMEAAPLPRNRSPGDCTNFFVGGGDGSMILDHEICILNGDLNYRIDSMTRDSVVTAVRQGNLTKLLERDQLLLSRKRNPGLRLRAFNEAPILFAPTYKYDVGTDTYDTSEKKRSPAWCDRVLYRGLGKIKQTEYRRHDCVKVSDHRPVSGRFKLRVKTINTKAQMAVADKVEVEFEAVKRRIAGDIKLDYLINVFGLKTQEAQKLLGGT
ncbi:DNase I-like protein [Bimuria novae-zelandiae CBS 107.79]|uniref:DNase I-like protein n=1 Tax=Bimuria novae-zelandiae CBS 107.79 TaxID=1447943 RepID=A0A6A5UXB0_9PLEO|nr:DNase I-like protein [Bimuria novae-zelandiae CBS 107.79]